MFEWVGFIAALVAILVFSRVSLALALFSGGFVLGFLLLPAPSVFESLIATFLDPSVFLLALAVGVIPVIGGIMEETGLADRLVENLRVDRRLFLGVSPALIGMLPMPGGALMSAPLVEKAGEDVLGNVKSAINVWFRHIPQLVYPFAASLIVSAKIANIGLYSAIPFMAPPVLVCSAMGYWLLLRKVGRGAVYTEKASFKKAIIPLTVILAAPLADFTILRALKPEVREAATLAAALISLSLAFIAGKPGLRRTGMVVLRMRPWSFSAIIFGMFFFLRVFQSSPIPAMITSIEMDASILCLTLGFLLGFATGRIQIPTSIAIPVFLARYGLASMPPLVFSSIYFSSYLGYIISPVHPCVTVSLEYFKSNFSDYMKTLILPTALSMLTAAIPMVCWLI
ncbi:hypothetical protein DRO58_04475 [Candidatus Bathyarchaeota archaeon]|nr:MAG: hypothetical protein DRO58_04475 [Candidatus Bathyarchaeota archaeon]